MNQMKSYHHYQIMSRLIQEMLSEKIFSSKFKLIGHQLQVWINLSRKRIQKEVIISIGDEISSIQIDSIWRIRLAAQLQPP